MLTEAWKWIIIAFAWLARVNPRDDTDAVCFAVLSGPGGVDDKSHADGPGPIRS